MQKREQDMRSDRDNLEGKYKALELQSAQRLRELSDTHSQQNEELQRKNK